jgi:RNA polymerase sigma factor (sigma-70 family)
METLPQLVIAAQRGDMEAFGQIVARFQNMAYGCAYTIVQDFHLAQDAAQEAFLEAHACLPHLREPAAFPGWFRRIVLKQADRLVRGKRLMIVPIDAALGLRDTAPDPAEALAQREIASLVRSAVAALAEHERIVTVLYYGGGYAQPQIAAFLDLPLTTVKKRLHDARCRLREHVRGVFPEALYERHPSQSGRFACVVQFLIAAERGDQERVRALLAMDPALVHAREGWDVGTIEHALFPVLVAPGYTALHRAAHNADRALAQLLIDTGAEVDARTRFGVTPLHLAVQRGATAIVALLLGAGANLDLRLNNGMTALHWAVLRRHPMLVEQLLAAGARRDIRDQGGGRRPTGLHTKGTTRLLY